VLPKDAYEEVFGAPVNQGEIHDFLKSLKFRKTDGAQLASQFNAMSPEGKRYWVNSWKQVTNFRESSPTTTAFWAMLEEGLKKSARDRDKSYDIELPSGRVMRYHNPRLSGGQASAEIMRMGKRMRLGFHAGILTENVIQATARDVFGDCLLRLEDDGIQVIMHAHDEAVCITEYNNAEQDLKRITKIMSTPPSWMPDLPQAAEGHICKRYTK
jgi:DNA polymerase